MEKVKLLLVAQWHKGWLGEKIHGVSKLLTDCMLRSLSVFPPLMFSLNGLKWVLCQNLITAGYLITMQPLPSAQSAVWLV